MKYFLATLLCSSLLVSSECKKDLVISSSVIADENSSSSRKEEYEIGPPGLLHQNENGGPVNRDGDQSYERSKELKPSLENTAESDIQETDIQEKYNAFVDAFLRRLEVEMKENDPLTIYLRKYGKVTLETGKPTKGRANHHPQRRSPVQGHHSKSPFIYSRRHPKDLTLDGNLIRESYGLEQDGSVQDERRSIADVNDSDDIKIVGHEHQNGEQRNEQDKDQDEGEDLEDENESHEVDDHSNESDEPEDGSDENEDESEEHEDDSEEHEDDSEEGKDKIDESNNEHEITVEESQDTKVLITEGQETKTGIEVVDTNQEEAPVEKGELEGGAEEGDESNDISIYEGQALEVEKASSEEEKSEESETAEKEDESNNEISKDEVAKESSEEENSEDNETVEEEEESKTEAGASSRQAKQFDLDYLEGRMAANSLRNGNKNNRNTKNRSPNKAYPKRGNQNKGNQKNKYPNRENETDKAPTGGGLNGRAKPKCGPKCQAARKKKVKNVNAKNGKRQRKFTPRKATLSGISSFKRLGDVRIVDKMDARSIHADVKIGPVFLTTQRKFGKGSEAVLRKAEAIAPEVLGKVIISMKKDGSAGVDSLTLSRPTSITVTGTLRKNASSEATLRNYLTNANPLVEKKLISVAKKVLDIPPSILRDHSDISNKIP